MNAGLRLILRPEVPDDLHAIVAHLDNDSNEVGDRFVANTFAAFDRLCDAPGVGSPKTYRRTGLRDVRSWAVPGFPNHLIYYQTGSDSVVVLAVLHGARHVRSVLKNRDA